MAYKVWNELDLGSAEVDGFEASGFVFATGLSDVPCTEVAIPPQQSLLLASHVPSSSTADVHSVYSDSVSTQVLFDGDRRAKHRSGKLFQLVAVPSTDHILKMESSKSIDCTI